MHPLKRMVGKYFYDWLYGLAQWGNVSTNNYGFSPVEPEVGAWGGRERYQIQLYRELTRFVDEQGWPGKTVLEVGCGRGGGLLYLAWRLKPASVTGLDSSANAIRHCRTSAVRQKLEVNFEVGDALKLAALGRRFDVVLSVEASHIFRCQLAFLEQVHQCLRPGGQVLLADYRGRRDGGFEVLRRDIHQAGFEVLGERDITTNTCEACRADAGRRRELLKNAPFFIRPYLREYAMLDENGALARFAEDQVYLLLHLLRAPAAARAGT